MCVGRRRPCQRSFNRRYLGNEIVNIHITLGILSKDEALWFAIQLAYADYINIAGCFFFLSFFSLLCSK